MNKIEVAQVLMAASGFDRFIVADEVTTRAWLWALGDEVEFEDAMSAVKTHFTGAQAGERFGVHHILATVEARGRLSVSSVEADVRSAKARGLIEKSWPDRMLLPEDVYAKLFAAREAMRVEPVDSSALDPATAARIGSVGRVTP
jgi:hypothetical protein